MEIIIRHARLEDYNDLCAIYEELDELHRTHHPELFVSPHGDRRPKEYIADSINDENRAMFVAEVNSKVVGFSECVIMESANYPVLKHREWVQLDNIAVLQSYQKHHIGNKLLQKVTEWAKSRNINRIELKVYEFNKDAIAFYTSNGFHELSKTMVWDL